MKIAIAQFRATKNKAKNIEKAKSFIHDASKRGAKWVSLPELFVYRGSIRSKQQLSEIAERINGPTVKSFQRLARQCRINILLGSIYEKRKGSPKVYNTSLAIDGQGKLVATYRKKNLFLASIKQTALREKDVFIAGRRLACVKINQWNVGLSICYDLRFSRIYRRYAERKVEVIAVPSNFTHITGQAHWEVLLRARAIEGLCYVVAPNQVGQDDRGIQSYGNSMVISPWGEIIARASADKEEIIYANLDKKAIVRAKKTLPGIIN